jgi:hypothetical protein
MYFGHHQNVRSAMRGLRDGEDVFEHRKADDSTFSHCEHDGGIRFDNLSSSAKWNESL